MEAETDVKTVRVDLVCPDCNLVMLFHEKFYYRCPRCISFIETDKEYPYYKYVSIKNLTGLNYNKK